MEIKELKKLMKPTKDAFARELQKRLMDVMVDQAKIITSHGLYSLVNPSETEDSSQIKNVVLASLAVTNSEISNIVAEMVKIGIAKPGKKNTKKKAIKKKPTKKKAKKKATKKKTTKRKKRK